MAHPEVAIHPYIRPVDWGPSHWSQLQAGEVERGNMVSVMLKSTFNASEKGLRLPIGFISASTPWACYGCVLGFNIDYWNPSFKGFIFNERLKPFERPAVEVSVLASTMLGSVADSSQLLHYNYVTSLKTIHESSAHLVNNGIHESPLPSAQPLQLPFCRGSAFALERGAELSKMVPPLEDTSPFHPEAIRSVEEIAHADIYADWVGSFRLWSLFRNGDMKKESSVIISQDGMRGLRIFKKLPLIFTHIKQRLHSLLNRGNRSIDSIRLINKSEESLIQIHGKVVELKEFISPLLVGFGNSVPRSYGKICGKVELLPRFSVNHVVKSDGIKHPTLKGYLRDVVAGISEGPKGGKHLLRIFNAWLKLANDCLRELHTKSIYAFNVFKLQPQFLPAPSDMVSLR